MKIHLILGILIIVLASGCLNTIDIEREQAREEVNESLIEFIDTGKKLEFIDYDDLDEADQMVFNTRVKLAIYKEKVTNYKQKFGYDDFITTDSDTIIRIFELVFEGMDEIIDASELTIGAVKENRIPSEFEYDSIISKLKFAKENIVLAKTISSGIHNKEAYGIPEQFEWVDSFIVDLDKSITGFEDLRAEQYP